MILADHAKDLVGRTIHFSFRTRPDDFYPLDLAHVADDGLVGLVNGRLRLVRWDELALIEEAA